MTREEAIARLNSWHGPTDQEVAHMDADVVLCALLTTLGYADVVKAWEAIERWYA